MVLLVSKAISDSTARVLRENREHYDRSVAKLNRYLSQEFQARSKGQQPSDDHLFYLIREILRLRSRLANSESALCQSVVDIVANLEIYSTLSGSRRESRRALKTALSICKFYCSEVEGDFVKDL